MEPQDLTNVYVQVVNGYWKVKPPRREDEWHLSGEKYQVYELIPQWPEDGWDFNGNFEKPTFSPSIRQTCEFGVDKRWYCNHFIITDGKIFYCDDSTHDCAGQTLELLPFTREEMMREDVLNRIEE